MGLQADLLKFYFEIESKYYALCDSLEKHRVPIYDYFVTPLEKSGFPSFPVAVIALLLVGVAAFALISMPAPSASVKDVYVKVLGSDGQPLENALVELLSISREVIASASSNSTGEVFLQGAANAKFIRVTHSEYEEFLTGVGENVAAVLKLKTLTEVVEKTVEFTPVIEFTGDLSKLVVEIERFGSFKVELHEKGTGLAISGKVDLFDAATDVLISEVNAFGGTAVFENLPLNQHVYFYGVVPGYSGNKSISYKVKEELQSLVIEVEKVETLNTTISILSSATKQPLQGAVVKIFNEDNVLIANATSSSSGNLTFSLSAGKKYYANVKKQGFVIQVSQLFAPSESQRIELIPVDPESTSVLKVQLEDEYNSTLLGIAAIYNEEERIIDQKTTVGNLHEFANLPRGETIKIKASAKDLTSQQSIALNDSLVEVTMHLEVRFAFIYLRAFDVLTGGELQGVNASVMRNGELFTTCVAPCTAKVKTRGAYTVNLSAGDYFDYIIMLSLNPSQQVFVEDSTTSLNASMMPLSGVQDSQVVFNGVFDASTLEFIPSSGSLKQNRVYFASLSGYFANASVASVYFNPSTTMPKRISILNFTPYPGAAGAPLNLEAQVSTSLVSKECGSGLTGGKLKRALLHIPSASPLYQFSQNYEFFFVAQPPESTSEFYDNLQVQYKSLIKKTSGEVIRNPFDVNLGTSEMELSGEKSECASQVYTADFNVISPNQVTNELGELTLSLAQNRKLSLIETINKPNSCGTIKGAGSAASDFDVFDCSGFSVDSGFSNDLQVNVDIELSHFARRGIVRFYANPEFFSVKNASFNVPVDKTLSVVPSSPVFEVDLSDIMATLQGKKDITGLVTLNATGFSERTELTVEFMEIFENGSVNPVSLNKTLWVSVNPVVEPISKSLLSEFSCGGQPWVNFSYNDALLPSGSGWTGCSEIPLIVDPIFPADAVPIYIENSTEAGNCVVPDASGLRWNVEEPKLQQDSEAPNGGECFELVEDTYLEGILAPKPGFKGYVLKFNAAKCDGVSGNDVFVTNATLSLTCSGRAAKGLPHDVKTVKVTVAKQIGLKNLVISRLKDKFEAVAYSPAVAATYFYNPPENSERCPAGMFPVYAHVQYNSSNSPDFAVDIFEIFNQSYDLNKPIWNNTDKILLLSEYLHLNEALIPPAFSTVVQAEAEFENAKNAIMPTAVCKNSKALVCVSVYSNTCEYLTNGFSKFLSRSISFDARDTHYYEDVYDSKQSCYYCAVRTKGAPPVIPELGSPLFSYLAKGKATNELDPRLFLVIDNLQIKKNLKRNLAFNVSQELHEIKDQSGPAFAIALGKSAATGFDIVNGILENSKTLSLTSTPLGIYNVKKWGIDLNAFGSPLDVDFFEDVVDEILKLPPKPILHYVEEADDVLKVTALRRSGNAFYYCEGSEPFSLSQCRPTLEDWIETTQSTTVQTLSCTACQAGVNCDASCNAEAQTKADGSPCFNYCSEPVCVPSGCVNGKKEVSIPGRATQEWVNKTPLVKVPLLSEGDSNAPFKYFNQDGVKTFNYTMVVLVGGNCADTPDSVQKFKPGCFVDLDSQEKLKKYGLANDDTAAWIGADNMKSATLKLTEAQGGCAQSKHWPRGYYRVTFSYYQDKYGKWKWQYYADPLEVSNDYVQKEDDTRCTAKLDGGSRRTKLCYFIFSTSLKYPQGPGYCIRSLRDYVSEYADPNKYQISKSEFVQLYNPNLPARIEQRVTENLYLRDMTLEAFGKAKCPAFDDFPSDKTPVTNLDGDSEESIYRVIDVTPISFNVSSFGLTYGGKLDYFSKVVRYEKDRADACYFNGRLRPSLDLVYSGTSSDGSDLESAVCLIGCRLP